MVSTRLLAEAFTIRKSLHEQWQDLLLSACEKAFDEAARGEGVIHIPKLEIHLKVTSEQELMEVLPELIQQQLNEQLQSINWETIPITQPQVIWQQATAEQNQFVTLIHYLQTGSVPWQAADAETSTIAAKLKETCRQQRSQLVNYLYNKPETTSFYFRLLQLLPETEAFAFVNALSDRFLPEWKTAITEFIKFVLDSENSPLNQPAQWQLVASILSECLSRSEQRISSKLSRIVDIILSQAGSDRGAFFAGLPATVAVLFELQSSDDRPSTSTSNLSAAENQETMASDREATPSLLNLDLNLEQQRSDSSSISNSNLPASENQKTTASFAQNLSATESQKINVANQYLDRNNYLEIPNEIKELPLNSDAIRLFENRDELSNRKNELSNYAPTPAVEIASTGDEFPLSVNHAGLVLLHPFISPFFEATGVKETNSKTIATSQRLRAAALLHFLATGQEELYEYELGLIKILLGLEPETLLLVGEGLLQKGDREEAETVLQSTINYWSVLKNTTINGLRSSFLQRSGLLRRTENGWELQVENQSFDMLLEHLPWSISIIKLSWMKQPLYTEWQTF
jgi:hypothetical protein